MAGAGFAAVGGASGLLAACSSSSKSTTATGGTTGGTGGAANLGSANFQLSWVEDVEFAGEWFGFTGKEDMVMFGSSYPHWQCGDIHTLPKALSTEQREKVCWRNAASLYGIDISVDLAAG